MDRPHPRFFSVHMRNFEQDTTHAAEGEVTERSVRLGSHGLK